MLSLLLYPPRFFPFPSWFCFDFPVSFSLCSVFLALHPSSRTHIWIVSTLSFNSSPTLFVWYIMLLIYPYPFPSCLLYLSLFTNSYYFKSNYHVIPQWLYFSGYAFCLECRPFFLWMLVSFRQVICFVGLLKFRPQMGAVPQVLCGSQHHLYPAMDSTEIGGLSSCPAKVPGISYQECGFPCVDLPVLGTT